MRARQSQSRADSRSSSISSASRSRASLERRLDQLVRVERLVVGRELRELERPEQRPEALAAPDGVDDGGIVGGQAPERRPQLLGEGAAALDDLVLGAELAAGHRPEPR